MILALQVLLAVAYALLAHAASAGGGDRAAVAALVALVAMVLAAPLAQRRGWAFAAALLSLAFAWWLYAVGQARLPLLLVPVAFVGLIAWVFARSLLPGRVPLIVRIVSAIDRLPPERLEPSLHAYARGLTAAWVCALAVLGLANLALALVASPGGLLDRVGVQAPWTVTPEQWSWFANLLNYGIVGGFFVVEFAIRKRRFPGRYRSFGEFLRRLGGLGPAFWRDLMR